MILKDHELLAWQGLIDFDITPGFRYKVKENGTEKQLFDGRGKYLECVGQGYGRRLTFESDEVLQNENFFWTDSNQSGYAFSIEAVAIGDVFVTKIGHAEIGHVKITQVEEEQKIVSSEVQGDEVVKRVKVGFGCKLTEEDVDEDFDEKLSLRFQGVAKLVKRKSTRKCEVKEIRILSRSGTAVLLQPALTRQVIPN